MLLRAESFGKRTAYVESPLDQGSCKTAIDTNLSISRADVHPQPKIRVVSSCFVAYKRRNVIMLEPITAHPSRVSSQSRVIVIASRCSVDLCFHDLMKRVFTVSQSQA
ncbi:hypothetical protein VTL71DRAFT_11106 [Oculimacula yallundae]|uniref:Uncharacterized protein n=1 Tax=Oculimacula yallundae TaxID=86028 RepID=A0ABR4CV96_9HELO